MGCTTPKHKAAFRSNRTIKVLWSGGVPPDPFSGNYMKYLFYVMVTFFMVISGQGLLASPLNDVLGAHRDTILKSSRKSIGPAVTALAESGLKSAEITLEIWRDKDMCP